MTSIGEFRRYGHSKTTDIEQCHKCGHPTQFHITQSKMEGARRIPTGRHRCLVSECNCIIYD